MLTMRRLPSVEPDGLRACDDRLIYQTEAWMEFLSRSQGGEAVRAEILDGDQRVGFFTGLKVRKLGVPVLGSPFPGWTTMYMGFNLTADVPRIEALRALERFAFGDLGCLHVEVADRNLTVDDVTLAGYPWHPITTFQSDLRLSEDELFGLMKSACRRCIRQAAKRGVTIEEVKDSTGFAAEYYDQLKDVFAKQGLLPTYPVERVEAFLDVMAPTGHLLLLRARDPEGRCIATGIYPGMNGVAQFWGNASYRADQHLRPNEALHWYAMQYWKSAGATTFDWGGAGDYKLKYGCTPIEIPWVGKSRFRPVQALRNGAEWAHTRFRHLRGRLHAFGSESP